jgi:hypothetical protein
VTLNFFDTGDALHIAEDADGLSTLSVVHLWQILGGGGTTDYDNALISGGTKAQFSIDGTYCNGGASTFTFGFTLEDDYEVQRSGTFFMHVCY